MALVEIDSFKSPLGILVKSNFRAIDPRFPDKTVPYWGTECTLQHSCQMVWVKRRPSLEKVAQNLPKLLSYSAVALFRNPILPKS